MEEYICKVGQINEVETRWDELIRRHPNEENWKTWKDNYIKGVKEGVRLCYYGIYNGTIVCEATAILNGENIVQNKEVIVLNEMAYLTGFRADDEVRGKGFFSKLYKFMEKDLKSRGYKRLSLGVEPTEIYNKAVYTRWGYTNFINKETEVFPDGEEIIVEYYYKNI